MKFKEFVNHKTVIFDGGMGTTIQKLNLPDDVWQGMQGNNEILNLTAPDVISEIHKRYFEAGCDVAVANTFGANRIVLAEYGIPEKASELTIQGVKAAQNAVGQFANRYVALSVGPGSKLPSLGQISYDELYTAYTQQMKAAANTGIDVIIIETCQDLLQIKAAVAAAMDVNTALVKEIPVIVSFTVEENGKMLVGTDIACAAKVLSGYNLLCVGLNCGFGPDKMARPMEELAKNYGGRLYLSPNAGMPELRDGKLFYPLSAEDFATQSIELAHKHGISILGGCCGSNFSHIQALSEKLKNTRTPSKVLSNTGRGFVCSAYSASMLREEPAPALVGERANATGSKAFRELLLADDYSAMAGVARAQEEASHIIDLSVAYSGRDENSDMLKTVALVNTELTKPLMIDSTSVDVIHNTLKLVTGKPVINSVNFEDGGTKLHKVLNLVKRFPAAVVALTIDENGMAQTKEDKIFVGRRIYTTWVEEYGFAPEDLLIDFLTFSVGSGDEGSRYAAVNVLEAIREFKNEFPLVNTILGVSNISFGLAPASRTVLNSVFLNKAVEAGLDAAIVHAEKVLPISQIGEKELELSEALLAGEEGALDAFITHFADVKEDEISSIILPDDEALFQKVLKGDSTGIEALIKALLQEQNAPDILNNILLKAMQEVGRQFNEGKMLLPFVLKSAEVMRECTKHLEPYLKGHESGKKGKVILATVKGDVHDIGKNLADIVLSGNGYEVINLGTKVDGDEIARAASKYEADAVGMSGLLVKSTEIMKENITLFNELELDVKVLLGGAALSEEYVRAECASLMPGRVYYCKDAFAGVAAMDGTIKPSDGGPASVKNIFEGKIWNVPPFDGGVESKFTSYSEVFTVPVEELTKHLRKISLFESRWGVKDKAAAQADLDQMLADLGDKIKPRFIYGCFPVKIKNNELWVSGSEGSEYRRFASFPTGPNGECFTDLFAATGQTLLPLQAVTLGREVSEHIAAFFSDDKYSSYYKYHGLLAELTEALAEYASRVVSQGLFLVDASGRQIKKVDKVLRYSFGYPLCPDLAGNKSLCDLLWAERAEITVNETFQMEPVYSTCAMLSWHPNARY